MSNLPDGRNEDQQPLMALVGEIVVAWSSVELILRMAFEGLGHFDPYMARLLAKGVPAQRMIQQCRALVVGLDDDEARSYIELWLNDADQARELRNRVIHSHWVKSVKDGRWATMSTKIEPKIGESSDILTPADVSDLLKLRDQIRGLVSRSLNFAQVARPGLKSTDDPEWTDQFGVIPGTS